MVNDVNDYYSLPGSSVHGILQARILEWVAISSSEWLLLKVMKKWSVLFEFLTCREKHFFKDVIKASWWKWKESEKVGLKLNIQNTKIMASGPITSWQIDGETVETVSDFILGWL